MARFYFDVHDGISSIDDEGTELPSVREARLQAAGMAGTILSDTAAYFLEQGDLRVSVRNEGGQVLLTISMLAVDTPAVAVE
jgi:hypothetical protein